MSRNNVSPAKNFTFGLVGLCAVIFAVFAFNRCSGEQFIDDPTSSSSWTSSNFSSISSSSTMSFSSSESFSISEFSSSSEISISEEPISDELLSSSEVSSDELLSSSEVNVSTTSYEFNESKYHQPIETHKYPRYYKSYIDFIYDEVNQKAVAFEVIAFDCTNINYIKNNLSVDEFNGPRFVQSILRNETLLTREDFENSKSWSFELNGYRAEFNYTNFGNSEYANNPDYVICGFIYYNLPLNYMIATYSQVYDDTTEIVWNIDNKDSSSDYEGIKEGDMLMSEFDFANPINKRR